MINLDKYQASKKAPVQRRSKETVRQILLAAAELFAERGVATVTTNDIADRAGIPIGSVYSYYEDKEAILTSLVELYYSEVIAIMDQLSDNPLLPHMTRFEVATIIINIWSYYLENNHPLNYVLYLRIDPGLQDVVRTQQARLQGA
ncbi:TetR/AcrR family transcriptional regulator, partial [Candidatus Saccharibacteria bacterium]|nr:TetR/AcrR family transcriptional regulator [Candidatus Saccharibacteria bacterium]